MSDNTLTMEKKAHEELEEIKQVDTVHQDEAVKVLATYDGSEEWSSSEETKLRRKIDWKLMPVLCITYGLQYFDKAMLGQAVSSPTRQG